MNTRNRRRNDRGAVLVEAAFVLPVLLFLFVGFIDFSLVIAGNSAGSNAVRDGARVATLQYVNADVDGSPNNLAIKDAVYARLGSLVNGTPDVDVACIKADSGATIGCTRAAGDSGVEVDRDLIEVTLTWTQIVVTPFVDSTHVEVIRVTINGSPDFSPDASPLAVYFDDPDQDGVATPVSASETGGTVNLVLHRSGDSAPTLTVSLGTGASSTAQPADYSFPATVTFASGVNDVTVPVQIINDPLVEEPDELLIVEIIGLTVTPATANAIVGQPVSVRVTIDSEDIDSTPPTPNGTQYFSEVSGSVNGVVDALTVEFTEPLANLGTWTLVNGPPGATIGSPVLGSNSRTVRLPVSGASVDTDGPFVVSATGVTDAFGNTQPTGNLSLSDLAPPVLLSIVSSGPSVNGTAQIDDVLTFNFSEPVTPGAIGSLLLKNNGTNDEVTIPGVLAPSATGGQYISGNGNTTLTFPLTQVAAAPNQIQVRLGTCSPGNKCGAVVAAGGTPTLGLVLAGPIGTADGRAAVLPTGALTGRLF
ncbi:MAG: TadE/TadG family type IV pilus assembly protein [Acidimicrobiales bacterium]